MKNGSKIAMVYIVIIMTFTLLVLFSDSDNSNNTSENNIVENVISNENKPTSEEKLRKNIEAEAIEIFKNMNIDISILGVSLLDKWSEGNRYYTNYTDENGNLHEYIIYEKNGMIKTIRDKATTDAIYKK